MGVLADSRLLRSPLRHASGMTVVNESAGGDFWRPPW